MSIRDTLVQPIAELTTWTFTLRLSVPDGSGGSRPPLLTELTTATLSVYKLDAADLEVDAAVVTGVGGLLIKDVDVKNTGRGLYAQTTGDLTITLHALDNPSGPNGAAERHLALVEVTYNSGADALRKELAFTVANLARVP